jgi:hypothetical protein
MEETDWETYWFNPSGQGYKLTHQTNPCGEITLPELDWRPWHSWERGSKFNGYLLTGAKMKDPVDYTVVLKNGSKIEVKNIEDYHSSDAFVSFYNYSAAGGQKVLIIALNKDNVDYFCANIKAIEAIQPSFTVVPA